MKEEKAVQAYNLSTKNHEWLKKQAESVGRSVSQFLDMLITSNREKDKKNVRVQRDR